jgi:hypothetical protein
MLRRWSPLLLIAFAIAPRGACAAIGDRFGYTSEDAALGGARVGADELSSASAFDNPAQLSLLPGASSASAVRFHWSVLYSKPSFTDIKGVVVQNPVNSDQAEGTARSANVDTGYPATFGQSVGFAVRSKKSDHHWGFGAVAYLPLDRFALLDSGESFVPEYTLHRGRTQKPEFQLALSGLIAKGLSFGAGINLGARLTSDTTIFLNQGAGTVSTMRIAASLKTEATPYFGLVYVASDTVSTGLVARLASSSPESLNVQASARAVGNVAAPDFSFPALATMYFDPFTVSVGTQWRYSSTNILYFQLDYEAWSKFQSPTIVIQNQACDPNCGVDFEPGRDLSGRTRDILVPRIGHSWTIGTNELRVGYAYRPGIYRELPTGAGNAIDPDEHRFSVGYGWAIESLPFFDAPGRLDLSGLYSIYRKQTVVKTPGDENGDVANQKVGAPGYTIGGGEWGAGFTVLLYL